MNSLEAIKSLLLTRADIHNRPQALYHLLARKTHYQWIGGERASPYDLKIAMLSREAFMKSKLANWYKPQTRTLLYANQTLETIQEPARTDAPSKEQLDQWNQYYDHICKKNLEAERKAEFMASKPCHLVIFEGTLLDFADYHVYLCKGERDCVGAMNKTSPLLAIPDDITPDWLDASSELVKMILDLEGKVHREDDNQAALYDKQETENRRIAKEAITRIQEIQAIRGLTITEV